MNFIKKIIVHYKPPNGRFVIEKPSNYGAEERLFWAHATEWHYIPWDVILRVEVIRDKEAEAEAEAAIDDIPF